MIIIIVSRSSRNNRINVTSNLNYWSSYFDLCLKLTIDVTITLTWS